MDFDLMINNSHDENDYGDYDNRPIRPMDQDALNEALARLPILIDEDDCTNNFELNRSAKTRRQPVLAYSTRRKNFSGMNISQSILNTSDTPMNNKRKINGCTSTNKLIKQIDSRQDLIQLKEENKILEETKAGLQLECVLLKKSHENELEELKDKYQNEIDRLIHENHLQCEHFNTTLMEKDQFILQINVELDNLRNDHTMLLLEKETLDKIVEEYQLMKEEMNGKLMENEITIKNLRNELENLTKIHNQKSLINGRMGVKEKSAERSRTINNISSNNQSRVNTITTREPMNLKKSIGSKSSISIDEKKKNLINPTASTRLKQKIILPK